MVNRRMCFRRLGHFVAGVLGIFYFGVDSWKLTSSNETENRIFDLDEEERICPRCKGKLVWIGKEGALPNFV